MPPKPVEMTHTSVFANGSRGGDVGDRTKVRPGVRVVVSAAAVGSTGIPPDPAAGRPAADGMGARFFHRRWGRSSHRYLLGLHPRRLHPLWHSIFGIADMRCTAFRQG
jgi:hypothetical protein